MSQLAEVARIGGRRYKYYPDVEAVLETYGRICRQRARHGGADQACDGLGGLGDLGVGLGSAERAASTTQVPEAVIEQAERDTLQGEVRAEIWVRMSMQYCSSYHPVTASGLPSTRFSRAR